MIAIYVKILVFQTDNSYLQPENANARRISWKLMESQTARVKVHFLIL